LGISLSLAGGGFISDWLGWRAAFYLGGLPGLVLSATLFLTVRDKPSVNLDGTPDSGPAPIKLRSAFAALWSRRSYVHLCIGLGLATIGGYGQFAWTPAFLMRTYHMTAGQIGGYYSAAVGPATLVAVFAGGALNDWLMKRDRRWSLWILAACFAIYVPISLIFFLVHNFPLAMVLTLVSTTVASLWVAPSYALVQNLAGPYLRAIAAAIFMMIVNIIGLGLGPYVTGMLSDRLTPRFGESALAISLCAVTMTCAAGVVSFLLGTRTVAADIDAAASPPVAGPPAAAPPAAAPPAAASPPA
jgi:predicted MFS family arabinose efflux permease